MFRVGARLQERTLGDDAAGLPHVLSNLEAEGGKGIGCSLASGRTSQCPSGVIRMLTSQRVIPSWATEAKGERRHGIASFTRPADQSFMR
jgi:hypothetical protein